MHLASGALWKWKSKEKMLCFLFFSRLLRPIITTWIWKWYLVTRIARKQRTFQINRRKSDEQSDGRGGLSLSNGGSPYINRRQRCSAQSRDCEAPTVQSRNGYWKQTILFRYRGPVSSVRWYTTRRAQWICFSNGRVSYRWMAWLDIQMHA